MARECMNFSIIIPLSKTKHFAFTIPFLQYFGTSVSSKVFFISHSNTQLVGCERSDGIHYNFPQNHPPGFLPSAVLTHETGRSHRGSGELSPSYTGFGSNAADLDVPFPQAKRNLPGPPQPPATAGFPGPYGNKFPPASSFGAPGSKLPPGLEQPPLESYRTGPWSTSNNQPPTSNVPRQRSFGILQQGDPLALDWHANEKVESPVLPTPPDLGTTTLPSGHGKKEGKFRSNLNISGSPPKANPYNNHRKARKTGEVDDLYYYLEYDRRSSPQLDPNRTLPDLETTLEADEQDRIFQRLNDLLSLGMFTFFAKHQFPIPIDPGKRRVRKPSDREWHEWLELAIALCEKRMIPKTLLHNERIKEFVTILQNSGEIRHVVAHPSRPLKSDMGVFQLVSAGIHVAQIIKDWDGMEEMLKIKENTENIIAKRRRRRESIKKHVRFLEQYAESEGLD
ncbi:hypothetical protein TWF694_005690 [Orbilia ellipsospora]|uniref:Uncharacterized protein n=1 Tax=Orbilia ellipsospora TaxID=2528407 RepID=A0AAV9WSQ2_9PEZI